MEKLNKACIDGGKLIKISEKLRDSGEAIDAPSSRFTQSMAELASGIRTLDKLLSELSFLVKHRQTLSGETLTLATAKKTQSACATAMHDLLEASKQFKALLPKKVVT